MSVLLQRYRAAVHQAGFRRGWRRRLEVDVKVLLFEPAGDPPAPRPGFGDSRRPAPPLRVERKDPA